MGKSYIRSGVWGWSPQEQERALTKANVFDPSRVYRDDLPARQAKLPGRIRPEWLTERDAMLRPTARNGGDTIHVATMPVLAPSEADLAAALAAAAAKGATIVAVDSGVSIGPDAGAAGVVTAIADWQRSKATARTKPGRIAGNIAAAEAKKRRTLAALPEARKLWPLPSTEMSSEEIAARVGLSVKTLYSYLGRRQVAQRRNGKQR